jgi:hypothetical protein
MDTRIIVEAEQRSEGWHNARLGMFTSSQIYRLMTKPKLKGEALSDGAKTYIMEKFAESLTGIREEVFTTKAMQWGIDNEPIAKKWLSKMHNFEIIETKFISIEGMNYGGSGDGWIREIDSALEVKCLNTANHLTEIRLAESVESIRQNLANRYWQITSDAYLRNASKCTLCWFDSRVPNDYGLFTKTWDIVPADVELMLSKIKMANDYFHEQLEYFTKF